MRPLSAFLLLSTAATLSAETRKWTNVDGRIIEADYVRSQDKSIVLKLKDGREMPVELAKLSTADQEFVKTQGPGTPAVKKGAGFSEVVLDKKAWLLRPQPETYGITGVVFSQQLETPHFLITAGAKVKPELVQVYAETCERLYSHIVRDLPGLDEKFNNRKMAVWLASDREEHLLLKECLRKIGCTATYSDSYIASVSLSQDLIVKKWLKEGSRSFDTGWETSAQRNLLWPERIHFLASTMLDEYGHSEHHQKNRRFVMFNLSYCYFLESVISGKIESKVTFGSSMANVEGFKNPRGWATAVKRIIGTTPLKPSLRRFMNLEPGEAEPIDVGAGYGLMQFIFNDPTRRAAVNSLLDSARKAGEPSNAEEFAKAMGAESPEAFDLLWIEFLKSDRFK